MIGVYFKKEEKKMNFRERFFRVFYPNGIKITKNEAFIIKTSLEIGLAKNDGNAGEFLEFKKSLK